MADQQLLGCTTESIQGRDKDKRVGGFSGASVRAEDTVKLKVKIGEKLVNVAAF